MVIIGVIVGGATLMFGDPGLDKIKEERDRLVMLLQLAQEESMLQSREMAIGFWEKGYSFYELSDKIDENGKPIWENLDDDLLRKREVPKEMEMQLALEDREILMDSIPDETPQVFFLSSGEMSPFDLTLYYDERLEVTINVNSLGKIETTELLAK